MNKKKIYLHGENSREIKAVEIDLLAGEPVLRELFIQEFAIPGSPDDYIIYMQEDEVFPDGEEIKVAVEIVHLGHVHFHRCEKIKTRITYNGRSHEFEFSPGATAKKVLEEAISEKKFNISEIDAAKLILKTTDEIVLKPTDHIGSFVGHDDCKLELLLVSKKLIEG
jgi:hypothetical protein